MDETNKRVFSTTCVQCVFNESRESKDSVVDCRLGRYELFRKRDELTEEGLINRICSSCRDQTWKNSSEKNPIDRIEDELKNSYSLVIFDDNTGSVLERLKTTLSNRQTIDPKQIIIIYSGNADLSEITLVVTNYIKNTNTKFNVIKSVGEKTTREMIDQAVKKCNGLMYILVENGDILPDNSIELLYNEIDVKLNKLIYVKPLGDNLTGSAIHLHFHKVCNGNYLENIEKKLEEALERETHKEYFKEWKDL